MENNQPEVAQSEEPEVTKIPEQPEVQISLPLFFILPLLYLI